MTSSSRLSSLLISPMSCTERRFAPRILSRRISSLSNGVAHALTYDRVVPCRICSCTIFSPDSSGTGRSTRCRNQSPGSTGSRGTNNAIEPGCYAPEGKKNVRWGPASLEPPGRDEQGRTL